MSPIPTTPDIAKTASTRFLAETQATQDYVQLLGQITTASIVLGLRHNEDVEIFCDPPVSVRVCPTAQHDIVRWSRGYLDPVWNVELVTPRSELEGLTSLQIRGQSYRVSTHL